MDTETVRLWVRHGCYVVSSPFGGEKAFVLHSKAREEARRVARMNRAVVRDDTGLLGVPADPTRVD